MKIEMPRGSRRLTLSGSARYRIATDESWTDCRLLDLSLGGAAIEIPVPEHEPTGRVILELLSVDGQPSGLQLRAEISNWVGTENNCLRVGLAFVGLTNFERYKLSGVMSRRRRGES